MSEAKHETTLFVKILHMLHIQLLFLQTFDLINIYTFDLYIFSSVLLAYQYLKIKRHGTTVSIYCKRLNETQ